MQAHQPSASVSSDLAAHVHRAIADEGGWLPFDRFMALALYAPGLGYYARHPAGGARAGRQFGAMPSAGSDFVTAPELSPLFGRALAAQVAQALHGCAVDEVVEFGAGTGALALQLIEALDRLDAADATAAAGPDRRPGGRRLARYAIVELSAALRERQRQTLSAHADRVRWLDALPDALHAVVVGNEVLDAMPVQLLHFDGADWQERGVVSAPDGGFGWADRPTALRPPQHAVSATADGAADLPPGTVTEIHPQAEAFIATLAGRLVRGAAFFIDYGFPAHEYYHPQRSGGTLMCHRAHRADTDPLADVGDKDITAHVDFSGIALAAQDAGLDVLGYTSQARFLVNCGLLDQLPAGDARLTAGVQKLLGEHEMGELFKVIGFASGGAEAFVQRPLGFLHGDRTHTL